MELFCKGLVWVSLDTQRLVNGQNLEEEGQLPPAEFGSDFFAQEGGIGGEDLGEWFVCGFCEGGGGGVGSHPELCIGFCVVDGEVGVDRRALGDRAVVANLAYVGLTEDGN